MRLRAIFTVFFLAVLSPSPTMARSFSPAMVKMFTELQQQPTDLARYVYLLKLQPRLSTSDLPIALQMVATAENELGLYNEALRDFPLKSRPPANLALPAAAQWQPVDAAAFIGTMAADRRLVMINEAHHDAHTRQLTLALLPRLRALGFNYFAAEALLESDTGLMQRGYPIEASGTEYLHEPAYGEIIRTAIRLGYQVVAYDLDGASPQERESGQASNLYRKVFARDPAARLFVHAGYAHIDKAKGRLGRWRPMAMQLRDMTGIEPLSIDQTQFREQIPGERDDYASLIDRFGPTGPIVLVNRRTRTPWSAAPRLYDLNVILPPAAGQGAVESGYTQPSTIVHDMVRRQSMLTRIVNTQRPAWLALHGQRSPLAVGTALCKVVLPCVVEARYPGEAGDAIAADRYAFMQGDTSARLYLHPGRYRLTARDIGGRVLSERVVSVDEPAPAAPSLDQPASRGGPDATDPSSSDI
jgi:hypothetical protein